MTEARSVMIQMLDHVRSSGGAMDGWWIVGIQADNGGNSGPGLIFVSEQRPSRANGAGGGAGVLGTTEAGRSGGHAPKSNAPKASFHT